MSGVRVGLYRGERYKRWRDTVLRNGKYTCCLCSGTENLTTDHIKPAASHPELFYDPSNGRVLCDECRVSDMLEGISQGRFRR